MIGAPIHCGDTDMERYADLLDQAQAHTEQETALAIHRIRLRSAGGKGRRDCVECGAPIPRERQLSVPSAERCTPCQVQWERQRAGCYRA
jgi:phage/conjugal plasmid C-4 type zinc finger TraR family protein